MKLSLVLLVPGVVGLPYTHVALYHVPHEYEGDLAVVVHNRVSITRCLHYAHAKAMVQCISTCIPSLTLYYVGVRYKCFWMEG